MKYTLYAITDFRWDLPTMLDKVAQAVLGGIDILQYRPKNLDTIAMIQQANALQEILIPANIPLIINDFCDVARVVDADGVHLGQDDISPISAREYLGNDKIIGLSVGNDTEFKNLNTSVVDYVGIGPIYGTHTKHDAGGAIGVHGFKSLRDKILIPCVGIGGITADNVGAVFAAGADGVAMISGIFNRPDISATIEQIKQSV